MWLVTFTEFAKPAVTQQNRLKENTECHTPNTDGQPSEEDSLVDEDVVLKQHRMQRTFPEKCTRTLKFLCIAKKAMHICELYMKKKCMKRLNSSTSPLVTMTLLSESGSEPLKFLRVGKAT